MTDKIKSEGTYTLNYLTLTVGGRVMDISTRIAKVDIYESIMSPSVIGEFTISDLTGMFSAIQLTEEKISISFTTHDDSTPVKYDFSILEVTHAKPIPNDKGVVMTLTCISEDLAKSLTIKNSQLVIQNLECEKVIKQLLDITGSKLDLTVEKTQGIHAFAFTNTTPFEAIDQARKAAISEKFLGSAFVFYQNKTGYVFKSLEKLIEEGVRNVGDKMFISVPVSNADAMGSRWRNILGFKIIQAGNQNVALATGGYSNKVTQLNLETGELEVYRKNSSDVNFLSMNSGSISSSQENQKKFSENEGRISLNLYTPGQENNISSAKCNYLPYYVTSFLTTVAHITIYGDSTISTGDIISCKLPDFSGLTSDTPREDSEILSGNYMVCKTRHSLTFGEMPRYYQGLEIVKDGIGGKGVEI